MKKKEGRFIVIEGNDGAGKSTQLSLLADYLKKKGMDVYATREPSDLEYGRRIRELALSEEGKGLNDKEWLELFTLDRNEHLSKEVKPAIKDGKIVLCGRYHYSTCIYQIKDEGKWKSYMDKFLRPDLALFILVPSKIAMERLYGRSDQITVFEKEEMIEERRLKYRKMLSINSNIREIDGSKDIKGVFSQLKKEVDLFLESEQDDNNRLRHAWFRQDRRGKIPV